jgi:glycine cleavage system H protein
VDILSTNVAIELNLVLLPARKGIVMDPQKLRYAKTHEWASLEGDTCTIGISQFAVEQLTDVIYIDLPDLDDPVSIGDSFGEIESVKAVSELYSPVNGEVIAVNDKLENDPSIVSSDPYGKGWMVKIKVEPGQTLDHLLTLEKYDKQIATEGH